jgi:hypothetical protein
MAPSKPLSFRPPEMLKNQTIPSMLPAPERKKSSKPYKKNRGARPNAVMFDEIAHAENIGEGMMVAMLIDTVGTPSEPKKAEKPKKPFVLDPHLTQRPFHDDRLMQLKAQLQRPSSKNR